MKTRNIYSTRQLSDGRWVVSFAGTMSKEEARAKVNQLNGLTGMDDAISGLSELEEAQDAAYNEDCRYQIEFDRMMNNEYNDGAKPPRPIDETLARKASYLAGQYPRAEVYLRAKSYTQSDNHHKYGAGKRAMELITSGGSLDEAEEILRNWLPEESIWN